MKTATITRLRDHLRGILDEVRNGETVEILHRRVPIARLVPVEPTPAGAAGRLPPWLDRLRRAGVVRVGTLKPVPEILRGFPRGIRRRKGNLGVDAVLEERKRGR
ncbi:MAG: type II toxin-antitoxin system Phd/YefM family antitoxin [Planctomycetes bacterium]|nr:type II toxin-antitoxin system Phd/YefM family antitoxin [Planctomycetota bacterium]